MEYPHFGLIRMLILILKIVLLKQVLAFCRCLFSWLVGWFGFSFSFSLQEELRNFFPFGSLTLSVFAMQI